MATVRRIMHPSDLRYTHDSVSRNFTNGYGLDETFKQLLYDEVSITSLPNLVAMYYDSKWFVVRGNRRLYIYKQLETAGKISWVTVVCVPFESNIFFRQYTTEDSGLSLRIRGNRLMEQYLKQIVRTWNDNRWRRQQPVTYESVRSNYPPYSYRGTNAGISYRETTAGTSYRETSAGISYREVDSKDTSVVGCCYRCLWYCCECLLAGLLLAVLLILLHVYTLYHSCDEKAHITTH